MEYEQAAEILGKATRSELRDHAFGDREVFWTVGDVQVAGGYFGGGRADVWFSSGEGGWSGEEARKLSELGTLGVVDRNDETGPDEYVDGKTMPGLTLEGVRKELTGG